MNLDELKELERNATPAPWNPTISSDAKWNPRAELDDTLFFWPVCVMHEDKARTIKYEDRIGFKRAWVDAEFIAALRNAAPALIALAEKADHYRRLLDEALDGNWEDVDLTAYRCARLRAT